MKRLLTLAASALPVLLILLTMAVAGIWIIPQIRVAALDLVGDSVRFSTVAGVNDPSDEVAARACYYHVKNVRRTLDSAFLVNLSNRPDVLLSCIAQFPQRRAAELSDEEDLAQNSELIEEPTPDLTALDLRPGDSEYVSRPELLAAKLGKHWIKRLRTQSADSCEVAAPAHKALEYAGIDPNYGFMTCAIGAENPDNRACCLEALGGQEAFVELLKQPFNASLYQAARDYSDLASSSFPDIGRAALLAQQQAELAAQAEGESPDDESLEDEAPDDDVLSKVDLDAIEKPEERFGELQHAVQDWVVGLGCALHQDAPANPQVIEAFQPLIESAQCAPTAPPPMGYYSAKNWSALCQGLFSYQREQNNQPPRQAICAALGRATVAQTITSSQIKLMAAVSTAGRTAGTAPNSVPQFSDVSKKDSSSRRSYTNRSSARKSSRLVGAFFRSLVAR